MRMRKIEREKFEKGGNKKTTRLLAMIQYGKTCSPATLWGDLKRAFPAAESWEIEYVENLLSEG